VNYEQPIQVAVRSKAWVCGRLIAGIVVSNPAEGMICNYCVLCDELFTLIEESYRVCLIVCDIETSTVRRLRP
jgi:hypothetical protein